MAPTRRPRKFGAARRRDPTSSALSKSEQSAPIVRKNRSRRSKKESRSSNSDSSRRRGILSRRKQREDGRGNAKERKRKAELARNLPRSNGKFAPRSGFVTPPNRSSRPPFQRDPSFLNYTDLTDLISPENMSPARYIEDLVQTPEGQQRLGRSIVKSVEKVLDNATISLIERLKERFGEGTRLNFDSDSESDTEKVVDSASESDFREASFSMFYTSDQIFESDYGEASPLMKTLTESSASLLSFVSHSESNTEESDSNSGSLLNCDSDDDEQDRNHNPTPPRKRRYSS